jgi:hypothetical protein
MNKGYTQLNVYACGRLGNDFYISFESVDFRSESSVSKVPYISAPVLTEEEFVSFFRRLHCRGLRKTTRQFWLNRAFFTILFIGWLITECFLFQSYVLINPLTSKLSPSAQRCLTSFFTGDFASWTVHFVNICVKKQQMQQLFIQFINYVS